VTFTLCVGEALIDFVAHANVGDIGASDLFHRAAGGAVANVAVGIARLGGAARFAGTISRDPFGRYLLRTLAHENVNVDGVRLVEAHTTLAFVARGEAGARDFFFLREPGADSQLSTGDISPHDIAQARVVHFGGVLLSSEPARSTCLEATASARSSGALVSFDPNARPALFADAREMQRWLLLGCAAAHIVKLSEEDLDAMGMQPAEARKLLNATTRAVIVSRGARGAGWISSDGANGEVASPRVHVVDTTGAGDAMMAAILWRLSHAHEMSLSADSLADAARYGCAAGALACLREGAIPALPTAAELEAMLSRSP
jgi:fructokinase